MPIPATTSSEPFPCRLPRHGKRLPDCYPTHVALTEDIDDILHGGVDRLEGAVVSGEDVQQLLGWRVVWQQRARHLLLGCRLLADDCLTELHALIADEHAGSGDERPHLRLRLPAKGTA